MKQNAQSKRKARCGVRLPLSPPKKAPERVLFLLCIKRDL
nr:MAG TPA: hypothetical protein [Caudoviricetes sp.]